MSTIKELNISPVGRVEGDLDVKVYMENGVVTRAHTQAAMFRGFEKIMEGKDPQSGLIVTPRICGICGGSHLYCASSALDTAWKTQLPPNALLLRAIGQATETIQSIPRWFYAIFATDLANKKFANKPLYVGKALAEGRARLEDPVEVARRVHAAGDAGDDAAVALVQRGNPGMQQMLGEKTDLCVHGSPAFARAVSGRRGRASRS